MRRHLLRPLQALLHDPFAAANFILRPQQQASAAGTLEGSRAQPPPPPPESGYRRLLRLLASPLPLPLLAPVHGLCKLVSVWECATELRTLTSEVFYGSECSHFRPGLISFPLVSTFF